jgi:glycine oxidase
VQPRTRKGSAESNSSSSVFYNAAVKTWDVIVVGGGIIGLSLAIELRKRGATVLIVERGEPGREASHAAAGMLADRDPETPAALRPLASASARMYPEFVHELQDESGIKIDFRDQGTLYLPFGHNHQKLDSGDQTSLPRPLAELEPAFAHWTGPVTYLEEHSVDPRNLTAAALQATRHREVDIVSGSAVKEMLLEQGQVAGVSTVKTTYPAAAVVNCAGAWAGLFPLHQFPTRPVKGQMLAVVGGPSLRHVIRSTEVYLVPRSDGRIVIGSTLEEAGFDKRTDPDTIRRLYDAAVRLIPALAQARMHEAWAGLRPGTPDGLPILGATPTPGYFVAAGHFRDGILLAPVTAHLMAQIVTGSTPEHDISAFSSQRFPN